MRFYKNKYPEVDDIVICNVNEIIEESIYVELLEYGINGMVQLSNASSRRKKKSVCLLKLNKQYPLLVIAVDKNKGYVDLSTKFLSDDDKNNANSKYIKYIKVLKIFNKFMKLKFNNFTEEDYINYATKTIWTLKNYECYDKLINYYYNNCELKFDLNNNEIELLKNSIKFFYGDFKIRSELKFILNNPYFGGVNIIKDKLEEINNKYNLEVKIDNVPKYKILIESDNKLKNESKLEEINNYLEKSKGKMLYEKLDIVSIVTNL